MPTTPLNKERPANETGRLRSQNTGAAHLVLLCKGRLAILGGSYSDFSIFQFLGVVTDPAMGLE